MQKPWSMVSFQDNMSFWIAFAQSWKICKVEQSETERWSKTEVSIFSKGYAKREGIAYDINYCMKVNEKHKEPLEKYLL